MLWIYLLVLPDYVYLSNLQQIYIIAICCKDIRLKLTYISKLSLTDSMNTQNLKKAKHHTYTFMSKVGSGNFGEAFLVQSNIDSHRYIIKVFHANSENKTWE